MDWTSLRARELPRVPRGFLNTAYFGPVPERALAAGRAALDEAADPSRLVYEEWRTRPDAVRALVARLVGVSASEVACSTSTSDLANRIALGLPLGAGDRVAVLEGDYPSAVLPWLAREPDGVRVDRLRPPALPVTAEWLASELRPQTRVLSLTHVQFDTGARIDLEAVAALARRRGLFLVVDGTQALGALALDLGRLPGVSAYLVSTYKWLQSGYGAAFGVVRPELLEALAPRWLSWMTTRTATVASDLLRYTTDLLPGAVSLDRGQAPAFVQTALLRASLELLLEVGPEAVAARGRALADRLVAGLDRERYELVTPETSRASIVSLRARDPGAGDGLLARVQAAGLGVSLREGKLRVSPHFFNDEGEVDRLLEALAG